MHYPFARTLAFIALFSAAVTAATEVRGELKPEEVAILAAKNSKASHDVAAYYAKARGIPPAQICEIEMPSGETLPRVKWEKEIRPAIRRWIAENGLQKKVRCFVTVWDVPLRIGPTDANGAEIKRRLYYLEVESRRREREMDKVIAELEKMAGSRMASEPEEISGQGDSESKENPSKVDGYKQRLEKALKYAQQAVQAQPDEASRQASAQQLQQMAAVSGGLAILVNGLGNTMQQDPTKRDQLRPEFELLRGRMMGFIESRAMLDGQPIDVDRDLTMLATIDRTNGLLGSIEWLEGELATTRKNETHAAFDSELSLVLWPDYNLLRWHPNYLNDHFEGSGLRELRPILMVSRIEAPTLKLTQAMIDTAIQVEKSGLKGTVYLDLRGMKIQEGVPIQPGSYEEYDQSLLQTEELLKAQTPLKVVVDREQTLFSAGSCPEAALYCGWYSLAKYVPAFQWQPGSVGYHLASSEATTLRAAESEVWCKRMLEEGVCATIGPVNEPYLMAFPRPH
ncbi:MAG: TIGR03790 family protein, partial [Planctomycetales bacterium]|nr:TIGR03790 family protein [Planctomycetales bacterium]